MLRNLVNLPLRINLSTVGKLQNAQTKEHLMTPHLPCPIKFFKILAITYPTLPLPV